MRKVFVTFLFVFPVAIVLIISYFLSPSGEIKEASLNNLYLSVIKGLILPTLFFSVGMTVLFFLYCKEVFHKKLHLGFVGLIFVFVLLIYLFFNLPRHLFVLSNLPTPPDAQINYYKYDPGNIVNSSYAMIDYSTNRSPTEVWNYYDGSQIFYQYKHSEYIQKELISNSPIVSQLTLKNEKRKANINITSINGMTEFSIRVLPYIDLEI